MGNRLRLVLDGRADKASERVRPGIESASESAGAEDIDVKVPVGVMRAMVDEEICDTNDVQEEAGIGEIAPVDVSPACRLEVAASRAE